MKLMTKDSIFFSIKHKSLLHSLSVILIYTAIYLIFFSPVLFSNNLLAPGDGFTYYLPAFYSARTLWTELILSGFPLAADPQIQTWYPLSLFFSLIPDSWNAFVVSAYVLASSFSYGYVLTITHSRLAALISGIIYGMSGFMMVHLGHTSIVHASLWMPLLIWALEKLRYSYRPTWLAVGVFAVSCSILAGHPQISVYTIGLGAVYTLVLGRTSPMGKWKYYRLYLAIVGLGLALAAIQIVPTAELSARGLRSKMTFGEFNSYSLPPAEAIQLLFPYFFGGEYSSIYHNTPYLSSSGLTETTGYVGLLSLMLAVVGLLSRQNVSLAKFWLWIAVVTFLLALGSATPLSWLAFHVPVYNKFRAPARHFIEMALAVSALSGIGVAAIQKKAVSFRLLSRVTLASFCFLIAIVTVIFFFSAQIYKQNPAIPNQEVAAKLALVPWQNLALGIPLLIVAVSVIILLCWSRAPRSKLLNLLLLLVVIADLSSFGWFYEWQNSAPSKDMLTATSYVQRYRDVLRRSHQRLLPVEGGLAGNLVDEIAPNMSMLWGVPSASGYGPLILSRVSDLLSMTPTGAVYKDWTSEANKSIDIMSIRYLLMPKLSTITDGQGVSWVEQDAAITLGTGCATQELQSLEIPVTSKTTANAIGIVSSLGCSTGVANNADVLRVSLTDAQGKVVNQTLRAGRDTSEWAYECSDVRPQMQHQKATVFESSPINRPSFPTCQGHRYVSVLPLERLSDVKSLELTWVGSSGVINIQKMSLIDTTTKQSYPIAAISNPARFRRVEEVNQTEVYENLRAMPRAWFVPETLSAKRKEILQAIHSSKLPDGRSYDPAQVALVEEPLNFKAQNYDASNPPKIVKLSSTQIEVETTSSSPTFLVLSDIYYPGWKARVDGKPSHIFKTNYILRGVQLPPGKHVVQFEFKPLSFHIGLGVSAATLSFLGYLFFKFSQKQKNAIDSEPI